MKFPSIASLVLLALLVCAVPASAQTLVNPSTLIFTVSPDHAQVTRYVVGYFLPGATAPVTQNDLPPGTPNAQQEVSNPILLAGMPFASGIFAKVKAVAGTMESPWSEASNAFDRAPLPPGVPSVRR
jgi:hypothetical protein